MPKWINLDHILFMNKYEQNVRPSLILQLHSTVFSSLSRKTNTCLLSLHDNEGTSFHQDLSNNEQHKHVQCVCTCLEKNIDVVKKFRFTNSGTTYIAHGGPEYSRMLRNTDFVLSNCNCNNRIIYVVCMFSTANIEIRYVPFPRKVSSNSECWIRQEPAKLFRPRSTLYIPALTLPFSSVFFGSFSITLLISKKNLQKMN